MGTTNVEQLLYELFSNAPIAIGIREVVGEEIVHVEDNPRAASMFGKSPAEVRGVTDTSLGVSRDQVQRAIARFRAARACGHPLNAELTLPRAAQSRVLRGTVVALDDPKAERYAFILEDVTELRALQAGIERAEGLAALGTLSATIGHEIANPTMYAQMQLQIAIERCTAEHVSPTIVDDLRTALAGVDQIARILRDMKTLVTAPPSSTESADVTVALRTVIGLIGPGSSHRATIHCETPELPMVRVSASRLVQVFLNLVRNAVESVSAQRGNVWVDVTQPTPGVVRIDIGDDGPGLDKSVRERLFEPFATTKASGTGLGLYVSRMIVARAGGTIEAHDREGGGARMRVQLPVAS